MASDYVTIFGFVQWVLRHDAKPYQLEIEIEDQQPVHRVGVLSNAQLPENIQAWEATLRDRGYVSDECQATTGSASPTCAPI